MVRKPGAGRPKGAVRAGAAAVAYERPTEPAEAPYKDAAPEKIASAGALVETEGQEIARRAKEMVSADLEIDYRVAVGHVTPLVKAERRARAAEGLKEDVAAALPEGPALSLDALKAKFGLKTGVELSPEERMKKMRNGEVG